MVSQVKVTQVEIGTTSADVNLTKVMYVAEQLKGKGPGETLTSPRFVPNTTAAIGVLHHNKYWEIVVGLDEDDYTALFATDVAEGAPDTKAIDEDGDNTAIGLFRITEKSGAGTTRTKTFTTSKTYVSKYRDRVDFNAENNPCEVTFICTGTRTVSAWA